LHEPQRCSLAAFWVCAIVQALLVKLQMALRHQTPISFPRKSPAGPEVRDAMAVPGMKDRCMEQD
jgi:hypothetical protein